MKQSIIITLFTFLSPSFCFSQDFGCYDVDRKATGVLDGIYVKEDISVNSFKEIDWNRYFLDSNFTDGYYKEYTFGENMCIQSVKMEGVVKNGIQEGEWKLYLTDKSFYTGKFLKGNKEGVWLGIYKDHVGDSICFSEIEFKNDKLEGVSKYYNSNGSLSRTISYRSGLKNGPEIEYLNNDTNEENHIRELKEYLNGELNGRYLIYGDKGNLDTLTFGEYSLGKKDGRFTFKNYRGNKIIVDYVDDKVEGKVIRYYSNGRLACEFDFRNNLPYNLIQMQDSSGNKLESTLKEGNGKLDYYYDNGKLLSSFEYRGQLIAGKFRLYYKSGALSEDGFLYANNEKCYKGKKYIEECEDLNLFSAWQLDFTKGTNYLMFDLDGDVNSRIISSFSDSICEDLLISEDYKKGFLINKETLWRGLVIGQVNSYYDNGKLKMSGQYEIVGKDSVKTSCENGNFRYYYSNGVLKSSAFYSNGKETGVSSFYDNSGQLKRLKILEKDGGSYNIYENDTVNRIDEKGRRQGKWISLPYSFSENNCSYIPDVVKYYKNDNPIGTWEYFYCDAQNLSQRLVWKDSANAFCQIWDCYGKLKEEGNMVKEKKVGEWKEYDKRKGYVKFKGYYDCGLKEGVWEEFNRNMKVLNKTEYIHGQVNTTH